MAATSLSSETMAVAVQAAVQTATGYSGNKTVIVPELDLEFIKERIDLPRAPFALVHVKKSSAETGRPHATYLGVFEVTVRVVVDRLLNMKKTLHNPEGIDAQLELVKSKIVSSFVGLEPTTPGEDGKLLTILEWRGDSDYDTLDEWIFEDVLLEATYPEDGYADNP